MGNAIYAEENSAAETNSTAMLIYSATRTSEDVYKLSTSLGSFFLRAFYLADDAGNDEEPVHSEARLIKASELYFGSTYSADENAESTESCFAGNSSIIDFDSIAPDTQVSNEISERILEAALAYSAEHAAVSYLERAEHSAELLRRKLKQNSGRRTIPGWICLWMMTPWANPSATALMRSVTPDFRPPNLRRWCV